MKLKCTKEGLFGDRGEKEEAYSKSFGKKLN